MEPMITKAYLILEDGTVLEGKSFGAKREVISEIVFNTSMTGYLEVLTDPRYGIWQRMAGWFHCAGICTDA